MDSVVWGTQCIRVRKALQQKPHVTGEVLSAVRKQRDGHWFLLTFFSSPVFSPKTQPITRARFLLSVEDLWKLKVMARGEPPRIF